MALRGVKIPTNNISMDDIHAEFTTDTTNQNFDFIRVNGLDRVWSVDSSGDNTPTTLSDASDFKFSSYRGKMRTPSLFLTTSTYTLKNSSLIYNGAGAVTYPQGGKLPPTWAAGDFISAYNSYGYDTVDPSGDLVGQLGAIGTEDAAAGPGVNTGSGLITNYDGTYSCGIRSWIFNYSRSPWQILVRFQRTGTHPPSEFNTYGMSWNGVGSPISYSYLTLLANATLIETVTETAGSDYTRVWRYETSTSSWLSPSVALRYAAGITINLN